MSQCVCSLQLGPSFASIQSERTVLPNQNAVPFAILCTGVTAQRAGQGVTGLEAPPAVTMGCQLILNSYLKRKDPEVQTFIKKQRIRNFKQIGKSVSPVAFAERQVPSVCCLALDNSLPTSHCGYLRIS